MLCIVRDVTVTGVRLDEFVVRSGKKGEPALTLMAHHQYKWELDDPYPASFWQSRRDKAVVVFGEYRNGTDDEDDDDGEPKLIRWLSIQSVLDLRD
jgi:hypothetical protein